MRRTLQIVCLATAMAGATVLPASALGAAPARSAQVSVNESPSAFAALTAEPPARRLPSGDSGLTVYAGTVSAGQLDTFVSVGVDRRDLAMRRVGQQRFAFDAVLTDQQADVLARRGVDLEPKQIDGRSATARLARETARGQDVFRSYSEPGGIRDELVRTTRRYPSLTELVPMGSTRQGREILAVKVTADAPDVPDGSRPAVLYLGAQHAREWITPEMVRRLMHHVLERYDAVPAITELLDTTELWFVPVANPDGYDFTFTRGNRLWRKNLRDNDRDGRITAVDGVDLNRNFPFKWGWDNEGSSPDRTSETYRGPRPASEPETRALISLADRVGFEFLVNYHSAAELLLYGTGWQVSTPTPDDHILQALAGTDRNPAVPGYDPDLSAELYTTNGDTDSHMQEAFGTLGFTPEMSTCQAVSRSDPDDEWLARDCVSGFNFPDDERLIRAEFRKNIAFAMSVAESAPDPDDPVSSTGLTAPDLVIDPFTVSYGSPQPVSVVAKRDLDNLRLNYRRNGDRTVSSPVEEWAGGERYGDINDDYYAEFRGSVRGAVAGDSVKVWFSADKPGTGPVTSERFTYTVSDDTGGDVLVLAAEDATGISPEEPGRRARYADDYSRALRRSGYTSDVYDVDRWRRTAPHALGVLSHYDAVVWETGDDIIPRETGQPDGTAAELALDLELVVRDYLNEGGKLLLAGKYAGFAQAADGVYYYNPFEERQGECTTYGEYPCLPLFNDFQQYWLGAYTYLVGGGLDRNGNPFGLIGVEGAFDGFSGRLNGGTSADNQDHVAGLVSTSSFLPRDQFPQFSSRAPVRAVRTSASPYEPHRGRHYMYSQQADITYKRLTRTVSLRGESRGRLRFQISYDAETDWDHVFVEARPVGTRRWTTLPDQNGHTTRSTGESCKEGWVQALHPFLAHYMNDKCQPRGSTGTWHAATGRSNTWQPWSIDLSRYAGKRVQLSITYASDWGFQGLGVFVDDAHVTVGGDVVSRTSFEDGLAGWKVPGAPPGSLRNMNDWSRSRTAVQEGAVVSTDDTVFAGFGVEGLRTQAMRTGFVQRAITSLLGGAQ